MQDGTPRVVSQEVVYVLRRPLVISSTIFTSHQEPLKVTLRRGTLLTAKEGTPLGHDSLPDELHCREDIISTRAKPKADDQPHRHESDPEIYHKLLGPFGLEDAERGLWIVTGKVAIVDHAPMIRRVNDGAITQLPKALWKNWRMDETFMALEFLCSRTAIVHQDGYFRESVLIDIEDYSMSLTQYQEMVSTRRHAEV